MSQLIMINPISREVHWLLNLRINHRRNRINTCLHKIDRLFQQSRRGDVMAIVTVFEWYQSIRTVEGYFDKEIARLTKLIRRKVNAKVEYTPYSKQTFRLPMTTPISASLYRIISKLDTLMCLNETCTTLAIFKKRRLFFKKTEQYKQAIMPIITRISQYKIKHTSSDPGSHHYNKETLSIAIHSDAMPVFPESVLAYLLRLTQEVKEQAA